MQTNDAETAGQAATLEDVIPALQGLEGLLAEVRARKGKVLESLVSDLDRLEWLIADERANKSAALRSFADDNTDLRRLEKLLTIGASLS